MELCVAGPGPAAPFLRARDRFETAFDLELPVLVEVRTDPDERTWAAHRDERHVLNISRAAANSAMAAELALHEFAHMRRYEEGHPSHRQHTAEALYLGLAGHEVERRKLSHCYQIANHMKDIYADDITVHVAPGDKLAAFFESELAAALADRPPSQPANWTRRTPAADPEITAINAAFALALLERHDLVAPDHRLYDLAAVASADAPSIDLRAFRRRFRELAEAPDESEYRRQLVDTVRQYVISEPRAAH
jgi:hypothetical protein